MYTIKTCLNDIMLLNVKTVTMIALNNPMSFTANNYRQTVNQYGKPGCNYHNLN